MKYFGWIIGCFIAGFVFGLLLFGGATNELKKSQSSKIPIAIPLIIGVVCGIVGAVIASNLIEDEKKREALGLNNIQFSSAKDGRKWIYKSSWVNPTTNETIVVKTFFDMKSNTTISTLNDDLFQNHNSNSGAEVFISKMHASAKGLVINQLLSNKKI